MTRKKLNLIRLPTYFVVQLLCLALAVPVLAQDTQNPGGESPPVVMTSDPISSAEIAARADKITATRLDIQQFLEATEASEIGIGTMLAAMNAELDTKLGSLTTADLMAVSQSEAEGYLQLLRRMLRQLETWQGRLQPVADQLDRNNQITRQELAYFESVLTEQTKDELSSSLIQRVESVVGSVREVRRAIREKLEMVLADLSQLSAIKLRITKKVEAIETGQRRRDRDVLRFDRSPIWNASRPAETLRTRMALELRSRATSVTEFSKANETGLTATVVALFIVIGMLLYARHAISDLGEAATTRSSRRSYFEKPISLSLLVWAMIAPQLFLPQLPMLLGLVRILVITVTLWRMLSLFATPGARTHVAGLIALSALLFSVGAFSLDDLTYRLVMIFVSAIGVYYFIGYRRTLIDMPAADRTLWWHIASITSSAAPWLLGISIIGVVIGAVTFGQQILFAVINLMVLLFAIAVVETALNGVAFLFVNGWGRQWLRSIRIFPDLTIATLGKLIRLAMFFLFLTVLPRLSALVSVLYDAVGKFVQTEHSLGTVSVSVVDLFALVFGPVIAIYVAKFVRFTLDEDVFPRLPIATGASSAASRMIYYLVVGIGIFLAIAAAGVELSRLSLLIGALGVGIGFGLQSIVNNLVSGLVLAFERPFQVGDLIAVGPITARVRDIGLRASRVRTLEGAEMIVPNADLVSGNVINWTLSDRMRRLDVPIGVEYGADPGKVRELLLGVAEENDVVAKHPAPVALFTAFGESSLDFKLRAWISDALDWPKTMSDLNEAVYTALTEAGIKIPFPQRTVHIRDDNREERT